MKHLFILIILLLLVGCGSGPELTSDILDRYEMAFTQGYIWSTGVITISKDVGGGPDRAMDSLGYTELFYKEAFLEGAFRACEYATTKINTRDVWLSNRINFLIDSLEVR